MTEADQIFDELTEAEESGDQLTVWAEEEAGAVGLEINDREAHLSPDEARRFADELEDHAEEEGWYHSGQTKPLLEDIREAADSVES